MNGITTLTVLTVCLVGTMLISTAVAENIEDLEQAIAELNKKYGVSETPTLTDEQRAEYDKRVQAINKEYSDIYDELSKKIAAIDVEFGIQPWPELTDEQWDAYHREIDAVFEKYYPAGVGNNGTDVSDEVSEFNSKVAELNKKYGVSETPTLTDEQRAEYDKRVQAINKEYSDIYDELSKKIAAIDVEFGIQPWPELTDEQWDAYHREIDAVFEKYYPAGVGNNGTDVSDEVSEFNSKVAEIDKKYGMPSTPTLTDEQWAEYDKRVQAVYAEYEDVYEEIDAKFLALDKEFGIVRYPELTEEQRNAFDKEMSVLHDKLNPFGAASDYDMDPELVAQLKEIDKKYGMPSTPTLTDEQWAEYDKRVQAVYAEYEDVYEEIDAKFLALDKEFGIDHFVLSPDDWEAYDRELSALLAKFDVEQTFGAASTGLNGTISVDLTSAEIEYEKQMRAIFSSFGFIDFDKLETLPSSFWRGIEDIDTKYADHLNLIGDPYASKNKTGSYEILSSEYLPTVRKLCGDIECVPLLTPSQIEDLDEQLSKLQKKFDNGEL